MQTQSEHIISRTITVNKFLMFKNISEKQTFELALYTKQVFYSRSNPKTIQIVEPLDTIPLSSFCSMTSPESTTVSWISIRRVDELEYQNYALMDEPSGETYLIPFCSENPPLNDTISLVYNGSVDENLPPVTRITSYILVESNENSTTLQSQSFLNDLLTRWCRSSIPWTTNVDNISHVDTTSDSDTSTM